jgi:hypothetical protein
VQDREISDTRGLSEISLSCTFVGVRFHISHTAENRNCAVSLVRKIFLLVQNFTLSYDRVVLHVNLGLFLHLRLS